MTGKAPMASAMSSTTIEVSEDVSVDMNGNALRPQLRRKRYGGNRRPRQSDAE
jgi:hypothetical protein